MQKESMNLRNLYTLVMLLAITLMPLRVNADLLEEFAPLVAKITQKVPVDTKLAIVPFINSGGHTTELGAYFSQILGVVVSDQAGDLITVIAKEQLQVMLQEQNLRIEDVEALNKSQREKLAGVDTIMSGKITKLGDNYSLICKIIEVKTGKQLSSSLITIKPQEGFADLEKTIHSPISPKTYRYG